MIPIEKITSPPWKKGREGLSRFLSELEQQYPHIHVRLVGGAVRAALLNRFNSLETDLDFAVNAPPEVFTKMAESLGVRVIPTGLKFGTVSCLIDNTTYEFTSLRKDIKTDGRHPVVEYTDSWEADAQRRDLTINALYADWDGTYYDPTSLGLTDLEEHYLRFIGVPEERVTEDYLRILRFFRFMGLFEFPGIDKQSLNACIKYQSDMLLKVSKERIWQEIQKIFASRYYLNVFSSIMTTGVFNMENSIYSSMDNMHRTIPWVMGMFNKDPYYAWLSGHETFTANRGFMMPWQMQKRLEKAYRSKVSVEKLVTSEVYQLGKELYLDSYLRTQMRTLDFTPTNIATVQSRLDEVEHLTLPKLPVTGNDLIRMGVPPGLELGIRLKRLEDWWIRKDFTPNHDECLAFLQKQTDKNKEDT